MKRITLLMSLTFVLLGCSPYKPTITNEQTRNEPTIATNIIQQPEATTHPYPLITPQNNNNTAYPANTTPLSITKSPSIPSTPVNTPTEFSLIEQQTSTPIIEWAYIIPTTDNQVLEGISQQAQTKLTTGAWYKERIQNDVLLEVLPIQALELSSEPVIVVFWVKVHHDKAGQRSLDFAPLISSVLFSNGTVYEEQWSTQDWVQGMTLENPLWRPSNNTLWHQQRYTVADTTGDRQPEVILSGCSGFGNECSYSLGIWNLGGKQYFSTESDPDQIGATLLMNEQTVIVRKGIDYYQYNSVEYRPRDIQLTFYVWDGTAFTKARTEIFPFTDWDSPNPDRM